MMYRFLFLCLFLGIFSENFSFAISKRIYYSSVKRTLPSVAHLEETAIAAINKIREEYGLIHLKTWSQLSDCAREHSQKMASGKRAFGHDEFKQRAEKMQKVSFLTSFGENVAYCFNYDDPVQICVEGWMNSPGHKKNILGDFEETGIGAAINSKQEFYITQLFAKRHSSSARRKR